jgi:hypothetical protein
MATPEMKRCGGTGKKGCGKTKPVADFGIDRSQRDGHHRLCRACLNEYELKRRRDNPECSLAYGREYRASHREQLRDDARRVRATPSYRKWRRKHRAAERRARGAKRKAAVGTEVTFGNGRAYVLRPDHPKANNVGRIRRAWAVLEDAGRPAPGAIGRRGDEWQVHHRNEVKDDDRLRNLVWMTGKEHRRHHILKRKTAA